MTVTTASRSNVARLGRLVRGPWIPALIMVAGFVLAAMAFFAINGRAPLGLFVEMVMGGFGDGYSISETLVKGVKGRLR